MKPKTYLGNIKTKTATIEQEQGMYLLIKVEATEFKKRLFLKDKQDSIHRMGAALLLNNIKEEEIDYVIEQITCELLENKL